MAGYAETAASDDRRRLMRGRAEAWIAGDPDPATRAELTAVLESGDLERLADLVGGPLSFGTAGLRGVVGPGPNRMNRAVVIRTTSGLARYLLASVPAARRRGVVVGFDARHDSEVFARDVVAVLAAAGLPVRWFTTPQPTPLVAYAQKLLNAAAAVVVTASHNPAEYNGYKVYGEDAVQITPPVDSAIAASIAEAPPASEIPRIEPDTSDLVTPVRDEVVDQYLADVATTVPSSPGPPLAIAYTPLHGVGSKLAGRALMGVGHVHLAVVESQRDPDPTFPTVSFPNPEEPGAMDAVVALGTEMDADLVVANDPDADRLAVAVPDRAGGFRRLTGNQIGVLLADHLLSRRAVDGALVVSSIVSTPMVHAVAASHRARSEVTLTGFKWICSAARALEHVYGLTFVYGFEEALGSCVGTIVHDKDGISAAVAFADLTRQILGTGESVLDHLDRLYREHGLWVSHQSSIVRNGIEGAEEIRAGMHRLIDLEPAVLGGRVVTGSTDFRVGAEARPAWLGAHDLVVFDLPDGRAMIRPSGTEPKCKVYVDLRGEPDAHADLEALEMNLRRDAERVATDLRRFVGL